MALVEVLSPCVTYNDTYSQWMTKVYDVDVDPDYRCNDRADAFAPPSRIVEDRRTPIGPICHGEQASLQSSLVRDVSPFRSLDAEHAKRVDEHLERVLSAYAV
jgi:pyruvate/2-oxoacid:ferredoxin oxidoreductase beta subunit